MNMKSDSGYKNGASRRSGIRIMGQLIGQVKPLLPIMILAIVLGVAGYLCAIFLTVLAAFGLLHILIEGLGISTAGAAGFLAIAPKTIFILLVVMAVLRGLLHYGEQYCNHFIAFKLLAIIRGKVFAALRRLCPAKLEGRDRGNLISVITSDIELLEVFYAHTISPIAIAVCTSVIMVAFLGHLSWVAGLIALCGYLLVGAAIPLFYGKKGADEGMEFRNSFGDLNSFVLDSLRGIDETIQYGCGEDRREEMADRSDELGDIQRDLNRLEASQKSVTNLVILIVSFGMMAVMIALRQAGYADITAMVAATVGMMSSFGPVTALASLSNNLNQTLASGERVLSILEEEPQVEEIPDAAEEASGYTVGAPVSQAEADEGVQNKSTQEDVRQYSCEAGAERTGNAFTGASAEHVDFSYEEEQILTDYSISVEKGKIIGIHGPSGSGKSTLLKLMMRFWDVQGGSVRISGEDVRSIPTARLRDTESYVTQETYLFHDSIANNIAVGKPGATREEIVEAAKKASIHDFIMTLPDGYDTEVGELGDTLSGGEAQRIGIARAFLHDAPFLLLDEPTSNLDSLNEGIILKSLRESGRDRTVLLVSHRASTMNVADEVVEMKGERVS